MTLEEMRLEFLKLARGNSSAAADGHAVVEAAREFEKFVLRTPASRQGEHSPDSLVGEQR